MGAVKTLLLGVGSTSIIALIRQKSGLLPDSCPQFQQHSKPVRQRQAYSNSFGAKVALSDNITKEELTAQAEFSFSINHSSTVSNTAIDYEIIRQHNGDPQKRANVNRLTAHSSFTLKRPPHIAVRPAAFSPAAGGKGFDKNAGNASFVILSESDWLTGFTPANGSRTGGNEKTVSFSYSVNNTEGDRFEIQVNQGGN